MFEMVDQAVDFVMAKIDRAIGLRLETARAPVTYELPPPALREAIVNGITHRDYSSTASVQVMLFADRLEVWSPGELPPALTLEKLRRPHGSFPRNPLLAEPMYLAGYAEKAGSGILDMIKLCREASLRPPEFRNDGGMFVQTLWRPKPASREAVTDKVTPEVAKLLLACSQASARRELQLALSLKDNDHFREAYLVPAISLGLIEMTIPHKPNSRLQKYRLTEKGRDWLAVHLRRK